MPNLSNKQPPSKPNKNVDVWDLVRRDINDRVTYGIKKHGTTLQPFNGRDALIDAYQEALDLVVYLRQAIYDRS